MSVNSARSCGGRRPSSTWPPVTPPRAPASAWDHRWRSRWHCAALLGGGWAVPDGARTSTTPSRWPDAATRQPSPVSSPGPTVSRCSTGCFGPMTPRCAPSRRRCRPPRDPATIVALSLAEYTLAVALLNRDAAADRHRGLELMMQARDIWLRERALFLVPVTDLWAARERARRGDRDAAIAVMRQAVDELHQAGRLFLWRLGHRRSGGDAAGAWRRG